MARVLITRAQPQADSTAELVEARGFDPLVFPLTQTETLHDGVRAVETRAQGVIVATSARAIEVLEGAGLSQWVGKQRWAVVGTRAATHLAKLGATLAMPAARDVAGLVEGLESQHAPLTYLAGANRKHALETHFPAMRVIPVYRAKALSGFSADAVRDLCAEPPVFALVYSHRGAYLLSQAIDDAGLQTDMKQMQWLCLSRDVADEAPSLAAVNIADVPTQNALLRLLKHSH